MFNPLKTLRDRRRQRQTYRQLAHLSDHTLADIGLTRHDLDALRRGQPTSSDRFGNQ